MSPYDAQRVDLERKAGVAQAAAITAERFAYLVAVLAAGVAAALGGWILSIPLAVAGYMLTVRPYHKAVRHADAALKQHEDAAPATDY